MGKGITTQGYESDSIITEEYWNTCQQFIQIIELKRSQNLMSLSNTKNFALFYENLKSEVDFDAHCSIGLGRRMAIPSSIRNNFEKANALKQ